MKKQKLSMRQNRPERSTKLWSLTMLLAMFFCQNLSATIEVTDDEGNTLFLDRPAERIISLAPALTELLYSAGAGDRLVGVMAFSDYPDAANSLPIVGSHERLDLERILQLQPDLIVAWQSGNPTASLNKLREMGHNVFIAEPKQLDKIPDYLIKLAILAGTESIGHLAAEDFSQQLNSLKQNYSSKAAVRIFYQVWEAPMISVGGNELINDIIELCGGENIFANISRVSPKISVESVLAANPEVIIGSGADTERPPWLNNWHRWTTLSAVQNNQIHSIPPFLVQRPTPRALQGVELMCNYIDQAR